MTSEDMKIAEVLRDPLIRQTMSADGVSVHAMNDLLRDAARRQISNRPRHSLDATQALGRIA